MINKELIQIGTKCTPEVASACEESIQKACDKFDINTPQRIAAFLSNVGIESAALIKARENMNYSAQRLAQVWPYHFAESPHSAHMTPNGDAYSFAGHPQQLAELVYGGRMGNGPRGSGDGWKYRGGGWI